MRRHKVFQYVQTLTEVGLDRQLDRRPLSWPIEQGARFKGVYNIYEQKLDLYQPSKQMVTEKVEVDKHTEELDQQIGKPLADKLRGDLELIDPGIYQGLTCRQVEEALEKYPDIRAVIFTSPTYEGLLSDVRGICEML